MKVAIEKVVYGGDGLARLHADAEAHGGKSIFVPFTLPGEQVEIDLDDSRSQKAARGYATGHLLRVEEASPLRTQPACPYFTQCGGCQLQHATYAGQVDIKRNVLRETLERAAVKSLPKISTVHGNPFHYRNRVRLHLQSQPSFAIGYHAHNSHTLIDIAQCPIAAPTLEDCLHILRRLGTAGSIPDGLDELELFSDAEGDAILLSAFTSRQDPRLLAECDKFFSALATEIPQITGAALFLRPSNHQAAPIPQVLLRRNAQQLSYRVAAHTYRVSIGAFFQVNQSLLEPFVHLVTNGWQGQSAWDLYAGVGLFSRVLAEAFAHVTAVEVAPSAVDDLRTNLADVNATIFPHSTDDFLRYALEERSVSPDLALLDPPRAGLSKDGVNLLARCRPRAIVYVSCDPATLSRDLKALIESGYRLDRLHMVDMFPQTYHQETVAVLLR